VIPFSRIDLEMVLFKEKRASKCHGLNNKYEFIYKLQDLRKLMAECTVCSFKVLWKRKLREIRERKIEKIT
jgi:DNA-directed RNA polymerase subunit RPC12/RpoP